MKVGPFSFGDSKSYAELSAIIARTNGSQGVIENLKGSPQNQLKEYKSWVFSCVSLISERLSTVEYGFYRKDTNEELTSKNQGYKVFTKPFIKPNELMSFRFLKSFCQIQWDLCGMTCIYKARNALGQVWELWPLNMNDFVGVDVRNNFMKPQVKYTFNFDDRMIEFDSSELIVIYWPNPTNMYEPMSPIQAHAYAVDIDRYVEVYERDFFKNSARIDMALTTDTDIDQEKADEIKERWKSKYSGTFHDIAVLSSGLKPVPLKFTNKDFEFLNLAGWSLEKILSCYKVPKSKLGFGADNRAGGVSDDISFNRECIQPRLTVFDEALTRGVLSSFDERIDFRHYNPVPRDRELEVKEARIYLGGLPAMTINQYRKENKLGEPIEGGDRLLIPSGWIPLDRLDEAITNQNKPKPDSRNQPSRTDPNAHADDEPHADPSGSDSRDELPTEGRAVSLRDNLFKFSELEKELRGTWNKFIFENLCICDRDNVKEKMSKIFSVLLEKTIGSIFLSFDVKPIAFDKKDWVSPTTDKLSLEYINTLFFDQKLNHLSFSDLVVNQFNVNPRLSKITNTLLRATINYSKYLILIENSINYKWVVNSNECGHCGRLKQSGKTFEVGGNKMDFPNQKINFNCDCSIEPE